MTHPMPTPSPPSAVDLTSCDLEPIHEIGSIQSVGFLVAFTADWTIVRVSENVADHLGHPADALLGKPFDEVISPDAVHAVRNRLSLVRGDDTVERAFATRLQDGRPCYDLALYRVGQTIIVEAEPSEPLPAALNIAASVRSMLGRMESRSSLLDVAREAARLIQALTGFDRVMVYRFLHDDSGEVIAERIHSGLEPYLGLRYPASDIPRQARALLVRNPVRVLADLTAKPVRIVPQLGPDGEPLDLSMSTLRSHSTLHLEYLRNMGVSASMTLSLVRNGKLWGMISCHHRTPRHISLERRTIAELFSTMVSLLLDRSEREEGARYMERTRQIHNQLLATMAGEGSAGENIAKVSDLLAELIPCDGIAVYFEGKVTLKGSTPTLEEFKALSRFLDGATANQVYLTEELGRSYPPARDFAERAAGVLAIPISRLPRDYLVFFRHEVGRTVLWAGDPNKPAEPGPNGVRLTPRKSFEAWQEIKRGSSTPWTGAEQEAAEALRTMLLEVVMQLIVASEAERQAATQKQELLIAELNHRVRNILGLIRGLITQSRTSAADRDTFAAVLGERVHALARAHDQITAKNWGPGSLATLIATEAGAYLGASANRIGTSGDDVLLQPQAFSTMALVIHELMTNAAKYGALSDQSGRVTIDWTMETSGHLVLLWTEIGGPPVQVPTRRGFGSTIIERSIPHELGGQATLYFEPMGLRVRLLLPSRHLIAGSAGPSPAIPASVIAVGRPGRLSGVVLLVEDNMIIALDAEDMLLSLGADRVIVASTAADALHLLESETPSFALLDVNLGLHTSFAIAARLREMGVRHMFATGYGNGINYPPEHRSTLAITKPYTSETIANALAAA